MSHREEPTSLKKLIAISNFGDFVGGGEYSFFDVVSNIGNWFIPIVVSPKNGSLVDRFQIYGTPVVVIPLSKLRPWLLPGIYKSIQCLKKTIKKANPKLIYANGSRPAFYGGIVGKTLKIPVIWHCRITEKDPSFDSVLSRLSNIIIVNSQATAKRFSDHLQRKIRIIHNGIDTQWFKMEGICGDPIQVPVGRILLVVARVSKWKGHDLALNAFEKIAGAFPDLHLVMIGEKDPLENEWWEYLQKRTVDSSYVERIHWIGPVEDVRPWYRAASILLLPSENEPFGRVLVEAMACGVPVVATSSGGVPEVVRHRKDGFLVPKGNSYEMAGAIKRILLNDDVKTKLGMSGKERAKLFSLESHLKSVICAFDEAIGHKRINLPNYPTRNSY
jgi:glycosyltransferase involved in cell wall biosynthesis